MSQLRSDLSHKESSSYAHVTETQASELNSYTIEPMFLCVVFKSIRILGLDELILQNMQRADTGQWQCLMCSFTSPRRDLVKGHVEARHIDSGGFACSLCGNICPTRKALSMHKLRRHKIT